MDYTKLAADPTTLVLGYNGKAEMFTRSPLRPRARASAMRWMFSSLLRFDENLELVGDLAERWQTSADGRTYTFALRKNAVWHDGRPVTADDVMFSAGLLQRPSSYFRNTLHLHTGEPATFKKVDSHTIEVSTPRPFSALPAYLTSTWASMFLIVPGHVVNKIGETAFEECPVGSGPFRIGESTDGGDVVLTAHQQYFAGAPKIDRVVLRIIEPGAARVEAFKRGELDIMVAPGRQFSDADARKHHGRLLSLPSNQIVQFGLNGRHPILKSVKVRQAIGHAVDLPRLVRQIEGPLGLPAYSPIGPTNWAFEPDVNRHDYNPAYSRELLADDGWRPGLDGIVRKDGEKLSFSVIFVPDTWNVDYGSYAEGIRKYLADVGIELIVRSVEYWSGMKPAWRNHDFGAFMYYDTFYNEPDLYWSWHSSMPKRPEGPDLPGGLPQYGYGTTGYTNAEVDDLIIAAREEPERKKRIALLSKAQKIMAEEVASLWLFNYPYRTVIADRVHGTSVPSIAEGTADLLVTIYPERIYKKV